MLLFFLFRIEQHLEPLAVTANVMQSAFCRLDEVLLTFGALMMNYKDLQDQRGGDRVACNATLVSLEKRWSNLDQDVLIAAVILNPFFKHKLFKLLPRFQPANIYHSFLRLWNRFFPKESTPAVLYQNVIHYLWEMGDFQPLENCVTACLTISEQMVVYLILTIRRC